MLPIRRLGEQRTLWADALYPIRFKIPSRKSRRKPRPVLPGPTPPRVPGRSRFRFRFGSRFRSRFRWSRVPIGGSTICHDNDNDNDNETRLGRLLARFPGLQGSERAGWSGPARAACVLCLPRNRYRYRYRNRRPTGQDPPRLAGAGSGVEFDLDFDPDFDPDLDGIAPHRALEHSPRR